MTIIYGIILGTCLSLFFSFGPSFFSMLQTSVHYGFRKSYPFPLGVSSSDIIIVFLMMTVLSGVDMKAVMHKPLVACIAGAALIAWGIYTFRRKCNNAEEEGNVMRFRKTDAPNPISMYFKGFFLNLINPLIWLYWISILSVVSGIFDVDTKDFRMVMFFVGMLGGCLTFDLLKCAAASLLQKRLTSRVINGVNKATGILLIIFALYLIGSMFYYKTHPNQEKESQSVTFVRSVLSSDSSEALHIDINKPLIPKDSTRRHKRHSKENE